MRWRIRSGGSFVFLLGLIQPLLWGTTSSPVEVKVEVAEVDNLKASNLGIEWNDVVSANENEVAGLLKVGRFDRSSTLQARLHMLVEEGAAELLASPNIITDSDTTATFHAGGQLPYVVSTALGSSHVEFKPYGVQLEIRPKLLSSGWIELMIKASVSSPDQTNGVVVSGTQIPALFERQLSSNLTLKSDSTVGLAGLIQTQKELKVSGVPLLRRIPILGNLFKWRRQVERQTTIIIFVTPSVVTL